MIKNWKIGQETDRQGKKKKESVNLYIGPRSVKVMLRARCRYSFFSDRYCRKAWQPSAISS